MGDGMIGGIGGGIGATTVPPRLRCVNDGAHIRFGRIRKAMEKLRIAAISYLNTAPLMWDFEHGGGGKSVDKDADTNKDTDYEISYTLPSECAQSLASATADIGIIPAAAYTTIPDLAIIPGVAIAARRAVRSILLVSKMQLEDVRTVALDTSSMTSVALTKILFAKWLGGPRDYSAMHPDLDDMLAKCDAALLIGDPALKIDRAHYTTLDLAEEWQKQTGMPFVFAFWAIRNQSLAGRESRTISEAFIRSRDHGVRPENLEVIAEEWAPRLNLTLEFVRTYLARSIHYYLDPPSLEGLHLYYRLGAETGALPAAPPLAFVEAAANQSSGGSL